MTSILVVKILFVCISINNALFEFYLYTLFSVVTIQFSNLRCIAEIRAYWVETKPQHMPWTKPSEIDNPRHHYQIARQRCICLRSRGGRQSGKCARMRVNVKNLLPVASSNICGTRATFVEHGQHFIFCSDLNSHFKKLNTSNISLTLKEPHEKEYALSTLSWWED